MKTSYTLSRPNRQYPVFQLDECGYKLLILLLLSTIALCKINACDVGFVPPSFEATPPAYKGGNDGSLQVFALSESDALIEYVLIGIDPPSEPLIQYESSFTNLPAGEYSIEVREAEDPLCSGGVLTFTLGEGEPTPALNSPSPSYTGPLYEGDPLQLFANPPDDSPYIFFWEGPNGFFSNEQNPSLGLASEEMEGLYTVYLYNEEEDLTSTSEIEVEVEEEDIGVAPPDPPPGLFPPLYPFEFCPDCCCEEEEEGGIDVMPPPKMIMDLSGTAKLTKPNKAGPESCDCEFNTYTGNFYVNVPLLSLDGLGPALNLNLSYNSCNARINTGYGNGWTHNYNLIWERVGNDIHIHRGDGRIDEFAFQSGQYRSPKGISDILRPQGSDQFVLESKFGMKYHFADSLHKRLTSVTDRNGNILEIQFTDTLATQITGACGRSIKLEYVNGLLTRVIDDNPLVSRILRFAHDAESNLRSMTDPLQHRREYIYDSDRKMIQSYDRRGFVTDVTYNEDGAVTSLESGITRYEVDYLQNQNRTIVSQPVGGQLETTDYWFDAEGRIVHFSGNCCGYDVRYQYNQSNDITRITDSKGQDYLYTYDQKGNVLSETDPLGHRQEFRWDGPANQFSYRKDKIGNESSCTFDAKGNVTSIHFHTSGIILRYSWFPNGLLESSTNGEGHTTTLAYNIHGNRTSIAHPIGTTSFAYDELGNQIADISPNGHATLFEYDALRQLTRTTDPYGHSIESRYDENGNEVWTKNKRGFITTRSFDAHNRLTTTLRPQNTTTHYTYDEKGNRLSVTDPNGNITTYTYGIRDLRTSQTNALGHNRTWEYDANGNLIRMTNYRGFSTHYGYDALNRMVALTDALGATTTYEYDPNGKQTRITGAYGVSSTFQYNSMGLITGSLHPISRMNKVYDKNGNLVEERDALGRVTSYTYDANDRLIRLTDAKGFSENYHYDDNGNTTAVINKEGHTFQTEYDAMDRVIREIDPTGGQVTYTYDENGNQFQLTDQRGHSTSYVYDGLDRLTELLYPIGSMRRNFDAVGNVIRNNDPLGRATNYEYNAIGQLLKTTFPDGSSIRQSYDENGNAISRTNEENETETVVYDALDRVSSQTNAENESISYTYDLLGNLESTTVPSGNVIRNVYDREGRQIASYDNLGTIGQYNYNLLGNLVANTDANNNTRYYGYDELYRNIWIEDPKGEKEEMEYDRIDNRIAIKKRNSISLTYIYDELNRIKEILDGLGFSTRYIYDAASNVISIIDANGNQTSYTYDSMNRLTKETFADGTSKEYMHDLAGNVNQYNDNSGAITRYTYDQQDRLILEDKPGINDDRFRYDRVGRMISAENNNAIVAFSYDRAGKLLSETLNGRATSYDYDPVTSTRTVRYPSGFVTVVETRDERGRLQKLTRNGQVMADWLYDGGDRQVFRSFANGTQSRFQYDGNNLVTAIWHSNSVHNFINLEYGYDKEGNKLYENRLHQPWRSEKYTYDDNDRLAGFQRGDLSSGNFFHNTTYTYDALGNRLNWDYDNTVTAYLSNEMNEYTTVSGQPSPQYDNNGNLSSDGTHSYQYGPENRLLSVDHGSTTSFTYDALGRRISKTTSTGTINYYYDGARIIEEQYASGLQIASYIFGNWIDDILLMQKDLVNDYFYHKNALGSVVGLTGSNGNLAEVYEYDAFGRPTFYDGNNWIMPGSLVDNPYLYTGRRYEEESGLYYYRARDYHPGYGRFLQRDPSGYQDGFNLYRYTWNNPTNNIDPDGLITVTRKGELYQHPEYIYKVRGTNRTEYGLAGYKMEYKFNFTYWCRNGLTFWNKPVVTEENVVNGFDSGGGAIFVVGGSFEHKIDLKIKPPRNLPCPKGTTGEKRYIEIEATWIRTETFGVAFGFGPASINSPWQFKVETEYSSESFPFIIDCCCVCQPNTASHPDCKRNN